MHKGPFGTPEDLREMLPAKHLRLGWNTGPPATSDLHLANGKFKPYLKENFNSAAILRRTTQTTTM